MRRINLLLYFLISLLIIPVVINSQQDSKRILLNQARRMEARRDYEEALRLYKDMLQDYPQDEEVLERLLNVYISTHRHQDAKELLQENKNAFSSDNYIKNKIVLMGELGNIDAAYKIGLDYLNDNRTRVNLYHELALVYERIRQYESAVEILNKGRTQAGDEYIFAVDLARNYQRVNELEKAITEYIKHLSKNTGFLYFVTNHIKSILENDKQMIGHLRSLLSDSDNKVLLEMYALALTHLELYGEAFEVYRRISLEKLIEFADEIMAKGEYKIASKAYQEFYNNVDDPVERAQVKLKIVTIQIVKGELSEALQILIDLTEEEALKDRRYRYRTRINREIREMLADVAIRMGKPEEDVIYWLNEAYKFAINQNERQEIKLGKVRYYTMIENYENARNTINETLDINSSSTRIRNIGYYYQYLLELMENSVSSDSLMAEMMINIQGDDLTNEAIFLSVMMREIRPDNKDFFLAAYREKNLYQDEKALFILLKSLISTQEERIEDIDPSNILDFVDEDTIYEDEEILIIAAQWADNFGNHDLAKQLYSYKYNNDALLGYATLKLSELQKNDKRNYQSTLTTFLSANPQNIFAPQLRLLLSGSN